MDYTPKLRDIIRHTETNRTGVVTQVNLTAQRVVVKWDNSAYYSRWLELREIEHIGSQDDFTQDAEYGNYIEV